MRTVIMIVVVAVALLAGNALLQLLGASARIDLTEQQLYSLSAGTRQVVGELQKPLTVELYFSQQASEDLTQLRAYAERVDELLQEYRLASDGQLTLRRVDPEPFSEQEDDATRFGLQSVPVGNLGESLYFGLVVRDANDNYETLAFLQPDREPYLEYELTQMIYRLQQDTLPVIGVLSGLPVMGGFNPATGQPNEPWMAIEQLQSLYEVRSLNAELTRIDSDVDVLLLIQPPDLTEQAQYAIDQFALAGGRVLAFIDPVAETAAGGMMGLQQQASADSLTTLLAAWGIDWQSNQAVLDATNALVVSQGPGKPPMRHFGLLALGESSFVADQLQTSALEAVNLSSVGRLTAVEDASSVFLPWLFSSADSMSIDATRLQMGADLLQLQRDFSSAAERQILAATVTGSARSAFSAIQAEQWRQPEDPEHIADTQQLAVTVVADTDVLSDRLWVQVQNFFGQRIATPWADNGTLLVNLTDQMAGSTALMSLRARGQYQRPFDRVEALREQAEQRFLASEQRLQQQLQATEQQLMELQPAPGDEPLTLTAEQQQAIEAFQQQKLDIRRELREVQHALNKDIDALGTQLKVLNILLLPLLLTLLVGGIAYLLQRRRVL
ncbi:ABC transporter [Bacterioplanes sanyensis]|uniref:ABC transporter n=1 Tax=Bacterioplanes sanyensis TaxID=1249553 RepID=A0A222FJJ2_9GAMM|nr:GldG family protein [Bacterioplanes sanyensis]ASP39217.1 ABC transporter [Bacterioplanes sanyensis]